MSTSKNSPTDLSDRQWPLIHRLLPRPKWQPGGPGCPPCDLRSVVNGILYVTKTGCQWRMLPKEFGCWQTVYGYFNRWSRQGVWQQVLDQLTKRERHRQGRKATPSAGCVDSQSIKTATQGKTKGYAGNKKINGHKRHLVVDTLGLIINERYNRELLTLVTTNHLDQPGHPEDESLQSRIGVRLRSRLAEMCRTVLVPGEDFRRTARAVDLRHR